MILLVSNQPEHHTTTSIFKHIFAGFETDALRFQLITYYRYIVEKALNIEKKGETAEMGASAEKLLP